MIGNDDTFILKYRKNDGLDAKMSGMTISVYQEQSNIPEIIKVYAEMTVRGVIQCLENKKYYQFDKHSLFFHGAPLENLDELISSKGIVDGVRKTNTCTL